MLEEIKDRIASLVAEAAQVTPEESRSSLELGKVGDLSSKVAFVVAKTRKENPAKLAAGIAAKMKKSADIERVEAAGPYINFYLSDSAYASILADILKKEG